jgi:hypothetical protein
MPGPDPYLLHFRPRSNTAADNLSMRYFTAGKQSDRFYVKAFDPSSVSLCNTEFSQLNNGRMTKSHNLRPVQIPRNASFIFWKHRMLILHVHNDGYMITEATVSVQ